MSVKVSSWVWEHSGAAGNSLLVLLALADNARDDGLCWPSLRTVAMKTRLSEDAVRRRIQRLADDGLVVVTPRPGTSNLIRIAMETPSDSSTPRELLPLAGALPHPSPSSRGGTPPQAVGGGTINEPSLNRQSALDEAFDHVWAMWPSARRGTRKKSGASFRTAVKAIGGQRHLPTLVSAVKRDTDVWRTWRPADLQYVPLLTTWLNQERWEAPPPLPRSDAPVAADPADEARERRAWLSRHGTTEDEFVALCAEHGRRDAVRMVEGRRGA